MFRCQKKTCSFVGFRTEHTETFICDRCKSLYCSEECKKGDINHEKECYETSKDKFQEVLLLLGYTAETIKTIVLPTIRSKPMFGFPGPISGDIPKKMIPIREKDITDYLTADEKKVILEDTDYHYLVLPIHVYAIWFHELTHDQKIQIRKLISG